ncbi:IQ motif and SEC7 domain-containing protein 1 isoform X2 [Vespula maculifrons]|uniref:IQ motif and SEC7 domain-containing protein 1 isoform X2 n=1 Tax=Vespula maculifrons TaxID=7453 RepID=A0ABD2CED4_VESMC
MSAVLNSVVGGAGGGGGGTTTAESATGLLDPDVETIIEEKNQLISRQYAEIERLQRELREVIGERDALICEVSKFKFEREMTDLKRLHDDSLTDGYYNRDTNSGIERAIDTV